MEFTDLSRYTNISLGKIPPFSELREMKPVLLTQELRLINNEENHTYVEELAKSGVLVVPIRRVPTDRDFSDRIEFPRRILFEMTSKCNVLCRMCPRQELKRPSIHMDKELYMKVLDEINYHGVEYLAIYHLGESLMHPDFKEILMHLSTKKNLGMTWMSTNGHCFNEEVIRTVLDSEITYINFSAHATTAETYKAVIPMGNFGLVQKNLQTFYRLKGTGDLPRKPFLHCQMIEQETTRHEVDAFIKSHYNRADIVSVNMLEYVNLPNNAFGFVQRERKEQKTCTRITRNDCFICSNGSVTPCDAAYNGEICFGDVNEKSLYEIWNSRKRFELLDLNQLGRINEMEFCKSCTDYDI